MKIVATILFPFVCWVIGSLLIAVLSGAWLTVSIVLSVVACGWVFYQLAVIFNKGEKT